MQEELDRSLAAESKADPAAYFLNYTVSDRQYAEVSGSNGALMSSSETRARWLEVQTRVGSYQLDNTHKIADRPPSWTSPGTNVTLDDDTAVLRREMWRETDRQYRAAAEALIKVTTSQQVQVQTAEGNAPDFSREKPHTSIGPHVEIKVERQPWEARVRKYTSAFSSSAAVLNSIATFTAQANNQYQVNSEGTKLGFGQIHYRLELFVQSKASDGMDIQRYANFDWLEPKEAPSDEVVLERIKVMVKEVEDLDQSAAGGSLRRTGDADRAGDRGFLSRSAGAPPGRIPAERYQRRADLHEKNRRADLAGIHFGERRPHAAAAGFADAAGLLPIRR